MQKQKAIYCSSMLSVWVCVYFTAIHRRLLKLHEKCFVAALAICKKWNTPYWKWAIKVSIFVTYHQSWIVSFFLHQLHTLLVVVKRAYIVYTHCETLSSFQASLIKAHYTRKELSIYFPSNICTTSSQVPNLYQDEGKTLSEWSCLASSLFPWDNQK